MRTLSRPMFNMGGPIKEGIMHGLREPYRSGTRVGFANGTPPINQSQLIQQIKNFLSKTGGTGGTAGATGTIGQTGSKAANLLAKAKAWKIPTDVQLGRGIFGGLKKAYSMAPKPGFLFRNPLSVLAAGAYFGGAPTPVDKKYGITSRWENIAPMFGDTTGIMEKKFKRNIEEGANPNNWWRYDAGKHGPRKENPLYDPDKVSMWPWDKGATETGPPVKTLEENLAIKDYGPHTKGPAILTQSMKDKVASAAKDRQLNTILDIMGYDKSKSTAVHRALVDASQIVTQAPGGDELDITKDIISPIIAATGKRLDKPEQIREAVGLLMAKGEIEKDVTASKGSQLKQQATDLVTAGVFKTEKAALEHLAKKPGFEDTVMAIYAKTGTVDSGLLSSALKSSGEGIPIRTYTSADKSWKEFKKNNKDNPDVEVLFIKDISDRKPGHYVVGDRVVKVNTDLTVEYKW